MVVQTRLMRGGHGGPGCSARVGRRRCVRVGHRARLMAFKFQPLLHLAACWSRALPVDARQDETRRRLPCL